MTFFRKRILPGLILSLVLMVLAAGSAAAQFINISSSIPKNNAEDVPLDTPIRVHFSGGLNTNTVPRSILYEGSTSNAVPTSIFFSDGNSTVTIVPKVPLKPGTYYIISLKYIQATSSSILNPWHDQLSFTTKGGRLSVITYVTPSELTLPPGGSENVTYKFIESGDGMGEIVQGIVIYEDARGKILSQTRENINFIIKSSQTTTHRAPINIPAEVGAYAVGQTITVRRIFEGIDHEGNRLQFRTGVKVTINPTSSPGGTAPLPAATISEVSIKVPEYGMQVPAGSIIPAEAQIRGTGSGDIHGSWNLDGQPKSFFVAKMKQGETVKVMAAEKAFAQTEGKHTLGIQLISPVKKKTEEIVYIVCSAPSPRPLLLKPQQGESFSGLTGTAPVFRWSSNPSAAAYMIAIGKNKSFKSSDWKRTEANSWTPDWTQWKNLGSGTCYWAVKPVFFNKKEGPESEVSSFIIKTSP